jgi:ribose transport system permease protein
MQSLRAREAGLFVALVLIGIGMSIAAPEFSTIDNLLTIGRNASEIGIMALGMTIVLITGQVDLSVGALYAAGGIAAGKMLGATGSPSGAIVVALLVGAAAGVVNGSLVGYLQLNSFMVTLGTLSVATGILQVVTSGTTIALPQIGPNAAHLDTFLFLAKKLPGGINMELVFFLILVVVMGWMLRSTRFGFNMHVVGGNPKAARIAGTRVSLVIVAAFALSGALAAFAGVLAMSFVGSMNASSGSGLLFDVFAAAVIGGGSLVGGRGSMIGTLLGALFLSVARNGLILLGVSPFWQTTAIGLLVVVAIAIDRWVTGRQAVR